MKFFLMTIVFIVLYSMSLSASQNFTEVVTNALAQKSRLVEPSFTNYILQCMNQQTNTEIKLSSQIIAGISQLEIFDQTMNVKNLSNAFLIVSNTLVQTELTTNRWQYWHTQLLYVACLNTDHQLENAYIVSSNLWAQIQSSGFEDTTNYISQALVRYYGLHQSLRMRELVALFDVLSAASVGKTNEVQQLKSLFPKDVQNQLEFFLRD